MTVLVLGASGYVGFPVAEALSRAGHIVYGQTRSSDKAKRLASAEITPIVSPVVSDAWLSRIGTLDVVIDCTRGDLGESVATQGTSIFQAVAKAAETSRPAHAPKLTFVYTSGTWVHGDNRQDIVSDTTPIVSPVEISKARPALEQIILGGSSHVNGIVIRPSLVYGRGEFIAGIWIKEAIDAKNEGRNMVVAGTPGGRLAFIHTDDVAQVYLGVIEKAYLCKGMVFDASNDFTESAADVLTKITEVVGVKGYRFRDPANAFEAAVASTALVRPHLAHSIFGWKPRKLGFVDGFPIYCEAYLAAQSQSA